MDTGEIISLIGVIVSIIGLLAQHVWTRRKFDSLNVNSNNKTNIQTGNNNQNEQ